MTRESSIGAHASLAVLLLDRCELALALLLLQHRSFVDLLLGLMGHFLLLLLPLDLLTSTLHRLLLLLSLEVMLCLRSFEHIIDFCFDRL